MCDEFDLEYADDLDALEGISDDDSQSIKSKRSLNFTTPKAKSQPIGAHASVNSTAAPHDNYFPGDDNILTPLESPSDSDHTTQYGQTKRRLQSDKKQISNNQNSDTGNDGVDEFDDLPDLAPPSKRIRTDKPTKVITPVLDDDFDITPPPSPDDVSEQIKRQRAIGVSHSRTRQADDHEQQLIERYDLERARVLRRIPDGDFVSVTNADGMRVYMGLKDEEQLSIESCQAAQAGKSLQLLSMSYADLRDQAEEQRRHILMQESQRITAMLHMPAEMDDDGYEAGDEEAVTKEPEFNLWVEKYAPRRYTQLLSDEATNRALLRWLKLWDYVVFGKPLPSKKVEKKLSAKELQQQQYNKKKQTEFDTDLDKFKRPLQKAALLCGPPGLGKTTLAHVIAQHSGYNVVEMNASDDRSTDIFRTKLEASTQMKAVLGEEPRPNCLVIDEIDGAPVAAINILLALLKKPDGEIKKKKNKKETGVLLRPIICVCNDLYVPALRVLRQHALVLTIPPTEPARLATRLYEVVSEERMKADSKTLLALCEKTDNDIRSCLNTLQFLRKQYTDVNLRMIQTTSVGQKDTHKTLFSVWQEIFTLPRLRRTQLGFVVNEFQKEEANKWQQATSLGARFQKISSLAQATGEYEKLTQGLFENYLEANNKDPQLRGLNLAIEWLCFHDQCQQYIAHTQDYSPMKFMPYLPVVFHLIFASNTYIQIKYPHSQFEFKTNLAKSSNLITSLINDMIPGIRKFLNPNGIVMDVLPPLMDIIQPNLRPVNTQLYSAREKADLSHLVNIMINYNMTYRQERTVEGQYTYALDPNMDEIVRFTGMKQHKQMTYGAKQLISREIDLQKMRKSEDSFGKQGSAYVAEADVSTVKPTTVQRHKQSLKPKQLSEMDVDRPVRDFFGRIVRKSTPDKKKEEKKSILAADVWFHYKAGYSNAVRKNVRVQDFL